MARAKRASPFIIPPTMAAVGDLFVEFVRFDPTLDFAACGMVTVEAIGDVWLDDTVLLFEM
jgi:hypothetical protein